MNHWTQLTLTRRAAAGQRGDDLPAGVITGGDLTQRHPLVLVEVAQFSGGELLGQRRDQGDGAGGGSTLMGGAGVDRQGIADGVGGGVEVVGNGGQ